MLRAHVTDGYFDVSIGHLRVTGGHFDVNVGYFCAQQVPAPQLVQPPFFIGGFAAAAGFAGVAVAGVDAAAAVGAASFFVASSFFAAEQPVAPHDTAPPAFALGAAGATSLD